VGKEPIDAVFEVVDDPNALYDENEQPLPRLAPIRWQWPLIAALTIYAVVGWLGVSEGWDMPGHEVPPWGIVAIVVGSLLTLPTWRATARSLTYGQVSEHKAEQLRQRVSPFRRKEASEEVAGALEDRQAPRG
jgi:hypothetical protein